MGGKVGFARQNIARFVSELINHGLDFNSNQPEAAPVSTRLINGSFWLLALVQIFAPAN